MYCPTLDQLAVGVMDSWSNMPFTYHIKEHPPLTWPRGVSLTEDFLFKMLLLLLERHLLYLSIGGLGEEGTLVGQTQVYHLCRRRTKIHHDVSIRMIYSKHEITR